MFCLFDSSVNKPFRQCGQSTHFHILLSLIVALLPEIYIPTHGIGFLGAEKAGYGLSSKLGEHCQSPTPCSSHREPELVLLAEISEN